MLKLRIITAIILIPLVVLAIFFLPQLFFSGLIALITLFAAWEFAPLIGWDKTSLKISYVGIVLALMFFLLFLPPGISILLATIIWILITLGLIAIRVKNFVPQIPRWLLGIMGVLILVAFWESLILLHFVPQILLMLLILVWTADTAAYFGGRLWGKHPLASLLSPKKTLEGFYCGLVMTILVAIVGSFFLSHPIPLFKWIVIALITFIAAVSGDLFESLLKRQANIKDSGQILPGHGGLLDRIDSLIAAAPVFFIVFYLF